MGRKFSPDGPFTTGEIAGFVGCCPRTVVKAMKTGVLKFFALPGSGHRRITRDHFIEFVRQNPGFPWPARLGPDPRVIDAGNI